MYPHPHLSFFNFNKQQVQSPPLQLPLPVLLIPPIETSSHLPPPTHPKKHTSPAAMKQLLRRLSRVSDCSLPSSPKARGADVPEGHLPVYVGDEMQRFVVRADLLSRPAFVELLRRSAQEYGYEQRGVLRIPCPVAHFQRVLHALSAGEMDEERLFFAPAEEESMAAAS